NCRCCRTRSSLLTCASSSRGRSMRDAFAPAPNWSREMSDEDPTIDAPPRRRLLRIISGLHAGASRELAEREMILVGSGDDCDIVLADAGVAAHHALISVVDGHFQLRALDAPLQLEGRMLHPGDPVEMDSLQRVGLGEAALAFGLEDDPAW